MYIAMNRFKVLKGKEGNFEDIWNKRDSHLDSVPGFKTFNLVRGKANEEYTLFASVSSWISETAFLNWTKSEAFRRAHADAGEHSDIYYGHPEFEGYEVII